MAWDDRSILVRLFGWRAALVHGLPGTLDRWLWLAPRLPPTHGGEALLDVGCGTGAYTIGAALRGYRALGLSWDERNQRVAAERAAMARADSARFEIVDVRHLGERQDLVDAFEYVICLETIEHILDDRKLFCALARCLKPGGRLLLTTPFYRYRATAPLMDGPFSPVEDGGHVRRGYSAEMLGELCRHAGLHIEEVSGCSGFASQIITGLMLRLKPIPLRVRWPLIVWLRPLPPLVDRWLTPLLAWSYFSICLEAYKPRWS
jgi:2-polyprenyl-3-methyl-5-hydroxy-6-metoxy-1,4-benzoquinol methylase